MSLSCKDYRRKIQMSVETWDPGSPNSQVSEKKLRRLLDAARLLSEPRFGLDSSEILAFSKYAKYPDTDWLAVTEGLTADELISLVRFFTLAETCLPGWEAGAKSPVIAMVRQLKERGQYPADLTSWIKENTKNRFLPYGSLMDRL
tara:strand:+ start:563 stop:1000 length:438 start_codon:yes stop_codon:yes gene_type:complete